MKLLASALSSAFILAALTAPACAAPTDVTVDAPKAFPESLTSTANGTLYIGSLNRGDAYITDTKGGRVLKLAAGSDVLTVWYTNDKSDTSLDGLVWQGDALYTNTYNGNHLIRIALNSDGSAGKGVNLATSTDIYQPDGMRLSSAGKILLVEGRGKDGNGRLDEVTVSGDTAAIRVIKDK